MYIYLFVQKKLAETCFELKCVCNSKLTYTTYLWRSCVAIVILHYLVSISGKDKGWRFYYRKSRTLKCCLKRIVFGPLYRNTKGKKNIRAFYIKLMCQASWKKLVHFADFYESQKCIQSRSNTWRQSIT